MRHKGSISQVNIQRDKEILSIFRQAKRQASWPTNIWRLCEIAADLPATEYYISDEMAIRYASNRLKKGRKCKFSNKYKQRLYESLYDKILELRQLDKYKKKSLTAVVNAALSMKAPCIGLTPRKIYLLLLRHKKTHPPHPLSTQKPNTSP